MEFKKIYDAIEEIEVKGNIFEQAMELCLEEKELKHMLSVIKNDEVLNRNFDVSGLEEGLNDVRVEMIRLNEKIKNSIDVIEEYLDVEVFCNHFGIDIEDFDDTEDYYTNILTSATPLGHCIRMALIHAEKLVKEFM